VGLLGLADGGGGLETALRSGKVCPGEVVGDREREEKQANAEGRRKQNGGGEERKARRKCMMRLFGEQEESEQGVGSLNKPLAHLLPFSVKVREAEDG
jgi:hypothetical protein